MVGSLGWRRGCAKSLGHRMAEGDGAKRGAASAAGGCTGLSTGGDRGGACRGHARACGVSLQSDGRPSWRDGRYTFRFVAWVRSSDNASGSACGANDAASGELREADLSQNRKGILLRESHSSRKALCNRGRKIDRHRRKALRACNRNVHRHRARRQIRALASLAKS